MQTSFTQSISPSWSTNFESYKPIAMLLIFQLDRLEVHVYKWYIGLTWFPVYIWSYFWIVISSFVIGGNRKCYRWLICPNCSTQHNKSTLEASCSIRTKRQIQIWRRKRFWSRSFGLWEVAKASKESLSTFLHDFDSKKFWVKHHFTLFQNARQ